MSGGEVEDGMFQVFLIPPHQISKLKIIKNDNLLLLDHFLSIQNLDANGVMLKYAELHECGGFASMLRAKESAEKASLQVATVVIIIVSQRCKMSRSDSLWRT